MSKSLKAAIYETHGIPTDVLRVVEQPWPKPAPDEVVVQMTEAPIIPASATQAPVCILPAGSPPH